MAEFAIVLPILLIILIAVFDVGRLVFAYNDITNAARNGARVAIVDQTANKARDAAKSSAGLGLKNSQVQVTYLTDDLQLKTELKYNQLARVQPWNFGMPRGKATVVPRLRAVRRSA